MAEKQLKITMYRSLIGRKPKHRATMRGLGLKKIGQTVVREDTPWVRGMVAQVAYLLHVEEDHGS